MKSPTVWILDDDSSFLHYMKHWFQKSFHIDVKTFSKTSEFTDRIFHKKEMPDLIIMDVRLDDENGLRLAKKIHHDIGPIPIIHLTYLDGDPITEGEYIILSKPINNAHLIKAVESLI